MISDPLDLFKGLDDSPASMSRCDPMTTKQQRHRRRKIDSGHKQITLMLPVLAVDALDQRRDEHGTSRVEVVTRLLLGDADVIEK